MNDRNSYFAAVFSRELDRWKKETKKSQEDFAIAIGLSGKNMITRYKKGTAYPEPETLESICSELGVDQSIFHPDPNNFDDMFFHDADFRHKVTRSVLDTENKAIEIAEISPYFWHFLWRIPGIQALFPFTGDYQLFPHHIPNTHDWETITAEDLDFIHQLQEDVTEYLTMLLVKKSLSSKLKELSDTAPLLPILMQMARDISYQTKEDTDGND